MFQRIFAMIAAMLSKGLSAAAKGLDFALDAATKPLRMIFDGRGAGGRLAPEFDPGVSALDLLKEVHDLPAAALRPVMTQTDRDNITTVREYVAATSLARKTVDLQYLKPELRAVLLTMSDLELDALSAAGPGAVMKFALGENHGVHGVPVVKFAAEAKPSVASDAELRKRVREAIRGSKQCDPFLMPKMLAA